MRESAKIKFALSEKLSKCTKILLLCSDPLIFWTGIIGKSCKETSNASVLHKNKNSEQKKMT